MRVPVATIPLTLCCAVCVSVCSFAADPAMVLDPKLSKDSTVPWLTYLGARSEYRKRHNLKSPSSGEITPTFAEEVSARQAAVEFYSVMKLTGQKEPYWDAMAKVDAAGFMKEYVWTYLRRKEWANSEVPKNLAAFQN